jgi:hypothetical protein
VNRAIALVILLAACSRTATPFDDSPITPTGPAERYGFVTTLGNDTVGAEDITRSPDAMISESVDRWPFVKRRHTEFAIAPDGRLTRMVMDVRTPNGKTPAERWRKVVARFTDDSVMVQIRDSSGVTGRSFATEGALTVPHVSMQYSVIEFEIASALRRAMAAGQGPGDTLVFRQFYPDRNVGPSFVLHHGYVMPMGGGKVVLEHDWLAGSGDVAVDSAGRMQHYSGQRSTYKVEVARTDTPPDVAAIGAELAAIEQRTGPSQLSVRDTARGIIGRDTLWVDYGRPLARGRVLLGNVVEYDRVWRTGANAATQFHTSAPISIAGMDVPAGTYTLWTVPRQDGAQLIVNKQTGQWGTSYDRRQDLGIARLQTEELTKPVEEFTISFTSSDATHGTLVLEWGNFRWTAPIMVR